MPPRQSNSRAWYNKTEIDYFAIFVTIWLSFNSYYRFTYANDPTVNNDREHIEKIKTDNLVLKNKFRNLFEGSSDEGKEFRIYLLELFKKYDGTIFGGKKIGRSENIKPQMNNQPLQEISFKDFIHPQSYQIIQRRQGYEKIGELYIWNNPDEIWPYYVEILYMLRNALIHGEMEPHDENHEIIKNCYYTLNLLIKDGV